jgi:glycosyltransferase involved in cell wall biosynthesis
VYECAELGIPFLASDVGGTRDLLREEDRAMSLIGYSEEDTYHEKMAMTGELLANRIREVLEKGALSARPRYDAAENDEKWLRWTTHVVVEYKSKRGGLNVASNYRDDYNSVVFLKDTNIEAKDLPFVSIVMTHYDRPRLCKVAIQSVIDQDYPHEKFEFILVDDKSPSHEAQLFLDSLEADFRKRNWKIVRNKENVYLGGARNVGFKHAKGKYVMFMDDDNYAKPHELRTFVVAMENGNADVLTSLVQFFWSHDNPLKAREIVDDEPSYLFLGGDAETGAFKNCFGDANCCVRATSFEKIGGYTEDKQIGFEDWEMYANASMRGFQVDIVPESVYYYRFSQGSMQRTTDYLINRKRSLRPYLRTLPKAMHSNLLKAAFPKASNNKNKQNIGKPSGMMAQGDARFHGVDEDTLIREGERQRREQEENFGHVEL